MEQKRRRTQVEINRFKATAEWGGLASGQHGVDIIPLVDRLARFGVAIVGSLFSRNAGPISPGSSDTHSNPGNHGSVQRRN